MLSTIAALWKVCEIIPTVRFKLKVRLTCGNEDCQAVEEETISDTPLVVVRRFQSEGWRLSKNGILCPDCSNLRKKARP